METLETILRDFKSGARDVAEGWGEDHGHFKLTRYTAVRDADGAYRGILEVNLDLTEGRSLSGEQAWPGW